MREFRGDRIAAAWCIFISEGVAGGLYLYDGLSGQAARVTKRLKNGFAPAGIYMSGYLQYGRLLCTLGIASSKSTARGRQTQLTHKGSNKQAVCKGLRWQSQILTV